MLVGSSRAMFEDYDLGLKGPPNRVLETGSPHWYISYNTGNYFDYGCVTTALVLGQCEYCLVLKGDPEVD